jgi:membrane carboxypeptidase/penicillin-binding protein PbpC
MFTLHTHSLIVFALCAVLSNQSSFAESKFGGLAATMATTSSSAHFSVMLAQPTAATYQWFKNGVPIPATDAADFQIPLVHLADAGAYHVVVSNAAGIAESHPAGLSVIVQPDLVSALPTDQTVAPGASVVLRATATGKNLNYEWSLNGTVLRRQNSNSLSLSKVTSANAGTYSVAISNKSGPLAVGVAIVRVEPAP